MVNMYWNKRQMIPFLGILVILNVLGNCAEYEGADCYHEGTNSEGVCVFINYCDLAKKQIQTGRKPETCRFEDGLPIVCCPVSKTVSRTFVDLDKRNLAEEKCQKYSNVAKIDPDRGSRFKIVNGTNATLGEFPHFAMLGYGDYSDIQWKCGGTLISENFILTAAHCILEPNLPKVAQMGDIVLDSYYSVTFGITSAIRHPEYSKGIVYNDIGLVQLDRKVSFTKLIKPACLPTIDGDFYQKLTVCGFGKIAFEEVVISTTLQKVEVTYFSNSECGMTYRRFKKRFPNGVLEDSQLCYGSRPDRKDSCQGDSGGPLQFLDLGVGLYRVVGIVSTGYKGCGIPGIPGVYTRVSHFVPWIVDVVWGNNI